MSGVAHALPTWKSAIQQTWKSALPSARATPLLVALAWACNAPAQLASINLSNLPPHPRLLLNRAGISELQSRITNAAWARASWQDLKAAVDRSLAEPVNLPPRGGNWSHHYVCPTHGARLQRGQPLQAWQWEHLCPVGNHILKGNPAKASLDFDGNAISAVHGDYARLAVDNGLVFQVTGETRYAQRAKEILLAYAARYRNYPLHDNQGEPGRGGRVASQSLSEASWLIEIVQAADLVWATFTESQRDQIARQLLRPALDEVILPRRLGIHNIQCRHNSAVGLVGLLLGDSNLVARAVQDPGQGFQDQLAKGVLADGMWLEGSSGYHFFTIGGLWPLAEAARNCGLNLYGPKFLRMFQGPLTLAMPDYVLPNFNDSGTVALKSQADYYELALARFGDPALAGVIEQSERRGRLALLFGLHPLPAMPAASQLTSRNSEPSGYAILQTEPGKNATWFCLKYGPHGGGHGHPDKNTFILYARGEVLAPDAGTHAYGSSLHRDWDKTTFAHNTLVVDQQSQRPATGRCLAFGRENDVAYAMTDAGPIYDGVRFVRTAAMLDSRCVLIVDQVQADKEHTFDLVYHQVGDWTTHPPPAKTTAWVAPTVAGYKYFRDATSRPLARDQSLTLPTKISPQWSPALTFVAVDPVEIITGYGILKTTEDRLPLAIQRQRGKQAAFVWAISVDGSPIRLHSAKLSDPAGNLVSPSDAILVSVQADSRQWSVAVNPSGKSLVATRPDRSTFPVNSPVTIR